jgi:hypothetical protein
LTVLLLAGCQAVPNPQSAPPPVISRTPSATEALTAIDVAPAGLAATCGDGVLFPAAGLDGLGTAQADPDQAAAALRAFLAEPDPEEYFFPAVGWHRVLETPTSVQFLAHGRDPKTWMIASFNRTAGGWTTDTYGVCQAHIVLGGGLGTADWWLDPALPRPGPNDRAFTALVLENACAGGPPVGRIAPPIVTFAPDAVTLIFGVRPLPGEQDCTGQPPSRFRVTLDEPLGNRRLLDGGSLPPRNATGAP